MKTESLCLHAGYEPGNGERHQREGKVCDNYWRSSRYDVHSQRVTSAAIYKRVRLTGNDEGCGEKPSVQAEVLL